MRSGLHYAVRGTQLFLLIAFALVGCGRGKQTVGREPVLRYVMAVEPTTLDPARIQDLYTSELLQNVFEGLVTFDAQNRIAPQLAERWEIGDGGRTYTFHLHPNARFHNGRPATAEDVKYSLERALWPETRSPVAANYLEGIVGAKEVAGGKTRALSGVRAVDPHTVAITLDRPRGYFLGALAYPTGWIVCREAIEKNGGELDEHAAIGTGPYVLSEYRHGGRLVLTANPSYYGPKPGLARIERPIVLDYQTAHVKYENGEVDLCQASVNDYRNDQKDPALKSQSRIVPQAGVWYIGLQERALPVFRDRRVRRAIAEAIDKDELSRVASQGVLPRADGFLPPGLPGSNPNIRRLPYDPADARKLLAEAGYPDGRGFPQLTLVYIEKNQEITAAAQIVRDDLKRHLGITIDLQERDAASFFEDTNTKQSIPFHITSWFADYLDPQDFLSTMLRTGAPLNRLAYSNPQFDALCDHGDAESDMSKRIPLYQQADQIAMDDAAVIPLLYGAQPMLVKPYVQNFETNLLNFAMPHYHARIGAPAVASAPH